MGILECSLSWGLRLKDKQAVKLRFPIGGARQICDLPAHQIISSPRRMASVTASVLLVAPSLLMMDAM